MKKIIAGLIALTAAFCSMTACSNSTKDEKDSKASEPVTEQVTAEITTDEVTTDDSEEETTAPKAADTKELEAVMKKFIDAYNSEDYKKTFKLTMPEGTDKVFKALLNTSSLQEEYDGVSEDEMIKDSQSSLFLGKKEGDLILGGILKAEPLNEMEEYDLKSDLSLIAWCADYIDKNGGIDAVDSDEMVNQLIDLCEDDLISMVDLTEAYYLTFELEYEPTGEKNEGYATVYRVNDGEWKVSANDFKGIDTRGAEKRLDTEASSISKAANTALIEMDERGLLPVSDEKFIVSSDGSRDMNVPDGFDAEQFKKLMKNYYESENEWFIKIYGGCAFEVAVCDPEKPHAVGTYPPSDNADFEYEGMEYDEIYRKYCEGLGG